MDQAIYECGRQRIEEAVKRERERGDRVRVIESLRQLGDVLHSTIVVRHWRRVEPEVRTIWCIMDSYQDTFRPFLADPLAPHSIVPLPTTKPHPEDVELRHAWVRYARSLAVQHAVGCGVGPWGWPSGLNIVDAALHNGGVGPGTLAVERRPWCPIAHEDGQWAQGFLQNRGVGDRFVVIEYLGYSLKLPQLTTAWWNDLVQRVSLPVVAIAGREECEPPAGAIDGRGCTFRQAKALIQRAACFVGRGSGLSVLAASDGCEQPVVELVGDQMTMTGLGYRRRGPKHATAANRSPQEVARLVGEMSRQG